MTDQMQDIPINQFDVNGSIDDYTVMIELKLKRAARLAPLKYFAAPVRPRKNPMSREKKNGKEI